MSHRPSLPFWRLFAGLVLGLHAVLIAATFRDYGMSWDQPVQREYAQQLAAFFSSGGEDTTAATHRLRSYGSVYELSAVGVERATGLGWSEARNLTSALFGWLGTFAAVLLGWRLFAPSAGVLAGVFLLLTPAYYGHSFINPKDLPFAALFLLALVPVTGWIEAAPRVRAVDVVACGLGIGLAAGTRIAGLLLLGLLGLGLAWQLAVSGRESPVSRRRAWLAAVGGFLATVALVWLVLFLVWPFARLEPWRAPFHALQEFSAYPHDGAVFYGGEVLRPSTLPRTYVPNLLLRTLPEFLLVGLGLGAWLMGRRGWGALRPARAVLLLASFLPLTLVVLRQPPLYDGLRHLLFTLPPLVVLAAGAVERASTAPALGRARVPLAAGVIGLMLWTAYDLWTLHPYQYVYFNRTIGGGIGQANRAYDLDYWATSLREAALWARAQAGATAGAPILYRAGAYPEQTAYYLEGSRLRAARRGEPVRLIFLPRQGRQTNQLPPTARVLHVVERQGVPFCEVLELPTPAAGATPDGSRN